MPRGYPGWEHGSTSGYRQGCRCDECRAAKTAYGRTWQAANREKVRELQRAQYHKTKVARLAKDKERYERDKGKILAKIHARTTKPELDPIKLKARQRRKNQAKKARHREAFVEQVEKYIVWELSEGICGICDMPILEDFHVDHILPLSRGGKHCYANVQAAHAFCNISKGNRIPGGSDGRASVVTY